MQGRRNGRGGAHDRSFASIFSAAGLLAGLLVAANGARAQEVGPPDMPDSVGPKHPITAYNGSYTYSIRIEVPAFRGIEPKLKLSYDSARGVRNAPSTGSWLGVGWKLDGLSAIERVSGSWKPPVDFSMQKLTGGRGSPAKDGTIYSYTALDSGTYATSFRWYLANVTDQRDNHVDYAYTCNTGEECVIHTIQYFNQDSSSAIATVTFTSKPRPSAEQLTYATGN